MTPRRVTDPALLEQLQGTQEPPMIIEVNGVAEDPVAEPAAAPGNGLRKVTDPETLRLLESSPLPPEVSAQDPARVGRVNQMARDTGLPREAVDQNLDQLEAKQKADRAREVAKDSPAVKRRLEDPATAAPTQDDVDNMALTEQLGAAVQRSWTVQKQGWSVNRMRQDLESLAQFDRIDALPEGERLPADQDPIGYQDMDPLMRRAIRIDIKTNLRRNVERFRESAERLKALGPQTSQIQRMTGAGNDVGEFLSAWMEAPVESILLLAAESSVPIAESMLLTVLGGGVGGLVARGAGAAVGAAAGQFTGSYMSDFNAGVVSGLQDAGVDLNDPQAVVAALSDPAMREKIGRDANAHALGVAVVDTATLGLIKPVRIARAADGGVIAGAKETAKESVRQMPAQMAGGAAGEQLGTILETGQPADFAETAMEALGETVGGPIDVASYVAGRGLGEVADKTIGMLAPGARRAREAEARAEQQRALIESSAASRARAHDPQAFAEFVAETTNDADTYVDADVFRQAAEQAGVDIAAVDPELGARVAEAAEQGADVRIPVADVAAKYSDTPLAPILIEHGRHSAGAMSLAEAAVFRAVEPEAFQQAVRQAVSEVVEETQADRERNVVTRWLRSAIERAGFERNAAEAQALIGAAMVTTMGRRTGRTPLQMMRAWPLKIRSMAGVSGLVNELLTTRVDEFQRARTERARAREEASPRRGIEQMRERVAQGVERYREAEAAADPMALQAAQIEIAQAQAQLESLEALPPATDNVTRLEDTLAAAGDFLASLQAEGLEDSTVANLAAALVDYQRRLTAALETGDRSEVDLAVPAAADGSPRTMADAMVDDIVRLVNNVATGNPGELQQSIDTTSPEFKAWFGDSKIVDEEGNPLVVYHGTTGDFDVFDIGRSGTKDHGWYGVGAYLTADPETASAYSVYDELRDGSPAPGANVMPVYVSMQNPYIWPEDRPPAQTREESLAITAELKAQGYDGVVVPNQYQAPEYARFHELVVFEPTQIKSAIGNRGTFDPNDPNILHQAVFHGSPHVFDRFDLSKIGTGEGEQVYGWGLYFAEAPSVAEAYRRKLARTEDRYYVDGKPVDIEVGKGSPDEIALYATKTASTNNLADYVANLREMGRNERADAIEASLAKYAGKHIEIRNEPKPGAFYSLHLPDDMNALMLDWDAPIAGQSEPVQQAMRALLGDVMGDDLGRMTGGEAYKFMAGRLGGGGRGQRRASEALHAQGLVGLRYLDEDSRVVPGQSLSWEIEQDGPWWYVQTRGTNAGRLERFRTQAEAEAYVRERERMGQTRNMVIWDQPLLDRMSAEMETELRQRISAGAAGGARGTFNPSTLTLTFLESANLTTFIHELGHFGLEILFTEAQALNAPADIRADAQAILEWFGVESLTAWNALSFEEKRPYHEKFAEGWETYAIEGRSPSPALTKAFRAFKRWFMRAYGALTGMRVQLTDEVRAVFDRMIAAEEEIAAAERDRGMVAAFDEAVEAGMPTEAWLNLQRLGQEATEEAVDQLTSRSLKDLRWLANFKGKTMKKLQAQARSIRKELTEKYGEQVDSRPVYQAISFLTTGETFPALTAEAKASLAGAEDRTHRLDRAALVELYGDGPDALWRRLPAEMITVTKPGQAPEQVAALFGYDSADAMIQAILAADPREQVIQGMVDNAMLAEHADLSDDNAIAAAVDEAVVNEARTRFVAAELVAFEEAMNPREQVGETTIRRGSQRGQRRPVTVNGLMRAAREHAETIIGQTIIRKLDRNAHMKAARREAQKARDARVAGDLRLATRHKRNQLVHTELARETMAAQAEVKKAQAYLNRLKRSKGTRKNIDVDQREQIDAILDIVETSSRSNRALDRLVAMREWVKKQQEAGLPVALDPETIERLGAKHLREYTVDDMRTLLEQIRSIEAVGRLKKKLLTARDKREFNEIMSEGEAEIRRYGGKAKVMPVAPNAAKYRPGRTIRGLFLSHRKLSSLARTLDGHKDNGWFWRTFVRPMNEAGDRETSLIRHVTGQMRGIFEPLRQMRGGLTGDRRLVKSTGKSWSREERIALALNWGNEGNRARVLNQYTEQQVADVFALITREEWQAVEQIWGMIDQFWPDIVSINRRLGLDAPKKVLPDPFTVTLADGTTMDIAGGYYPLHYEPLLSNRAAQFDELQNLQQIIQGGNLNPTTRRGHEKARAENVTEPLRLTLDVLERHLSNVIHDLSWREWLIDANRILADRRVADAIREHYSPEFLKAIKDTVLDIATGDQQRANAVSRIMSWSRGAVTAATMGFSLTTALLQPFGIFQAVPRVGAGWLLRGVAHWGGDLAKLESSAQKIYAMSPMMRHRGETMNREMREVMQQVHHGRSQFAHMRDVSMFYLMQKLQQTVDIPVWWGAYEKALATNPGDSAYAARMADQAVVDTQGGGSIKDLAGVQRGGELSKVMTMFYSYFSATYNQIAESTGRTNFKNPVQVAAWIGDMIALSIIPVVAQELVFEFIRSAGAEDDEPKEAEEWAEDLFLEWVGFMMGTMVGVRELSGAIKGFDYEGPAAFRVVSEAVKLAREAGKIASDDEDFDTDNLRRAVKAVMTLAGLPAAQINRSWRGIEAYMDGRAGPGAILLGPPAESNRR